MVQTHLYSGLVSDFKSCLKYSYFPRNAQYSCKHYLKVPYYSYSQIFIFTSDSSEADCMSKYF